MPAELEERSQWPVLLTGAVVVLVVSAGAYLLLRHTQTAGSAAQRLPFGPAEQAYAQRIYFRKLQMSRAANLLNQEITFLSGEMENAGTRDVDDIEVTVEYRDSLQQVILREEHRPLGSPRPVPVPAGQARQFQLAFEHIPDDWNHEYPAIRVTGLRLE